VLKFNPVNPLAGKRKEWLLNNRDHRKLLVVDGRVALIGGINISETYSSGSSTRKAGKKGPGHPPADRRAGGGGIPEAVHGHLEQAEWPAAGQ
jgi:cardiolipin synthase